MMRKIVLCVLLAVFLGIVISVQEARAQIISWDAVFVTGGPHSSRYREFHQTTPLWQFGSLKIEGGMGVTAWRYWCAYPDCSWPGEWRWVTRPSLLTRARLSIFTADDVDIYNLSWLSATFSHEGQLFPTFQRVDLFTAIGIEFHLSSELAVHGELGSPIGWKRIRTTIGLGLSWRF